MSRLALLFIMLILSNISTTVANGPINFPYRVITAQLINDHSLNYLRKSEITGTSLLPPWITEFSATPITMGCLEGFQLTTAVPADKGCIWDSDPLDFNDDIDYTFEANFGNSDAGADGICLIFKDNGSGCGTGGGGIGADGLVTTFIVEFDTWDNGPGFGDIPDDHVSVDINGDLTMPISGPISLGNIEDGMNHQIQFVWSAGSQTYEIYFDGSLKITGVYDIAGLFPGGTAYTGFSASTGGAVNNQSVFPGGEIGPPEPPMFTLYDFLVCENETGVTYTVQPVPGITYSWTVPPGASIIGSGNSIKVNFGSQSGQVCVTANNGCEESDPVCVDVEVIPIPDVEAVDPPVNCDSQFDLKDVVINGLDPSYSVTYYATSAAATAGTPQLPSTIIYSSGIYWIRVVSPEGCFKVISVDVDFEVVSIEVTDPKPVCEPEFVNLPADVDVIESNGLDIVYIKFFATQADAIIGSPELSNLNITQSGTYWVRAETINGCFDIESFNVVINLMPDIEISQPPVQCLGDTLDLNTLDILDNKGTDPDQLINSFYLSLDDAQQNKNALSPAVIWYNATIWVRSETNEGCFDIKSIDIIFKPASIATISGSKTVCKGSSATITIDFNGQPPFKGSFGNGTNVYTFNTNNNIYTINVNVDSNQVFKLITFSDGSSNSCPPVMAGEAKFTLFTAPDLQIIIPAPICKDSSFSIQFILNKYFPASINFSLGGITYSHTSDSSSFYLTNLSTNSQLIILDIKDVNACTYLLNDTFNIDINQPPTISNIKETCTNTDFVVTFDISGGDPSSYTVNGSTTGIVGNTFTSPLLPNKTNYSFSVDDGNGCGPILITGTKDCSCITDAGTMDLNTIDFCIDFADTVIHNNDQILDANDNLLFVLHDGNGSNLGNIKAVNTIPYFPFNPTNMSVETVYFISAVAGNGSGPGMIDINDPCLSVATGTPVIYHALPEILAEDVTVCNGDTAIINLSLKGNGPFNITVKKDGQLLSTLITNSNTHSFKDYTIKDAIYSFSITDKYCNGIIPVNGQVTVRKKLDVTNIVHNCSADQKSYTISFKINGGDPGSYAITGINGILTGSDFVSESINSGDTYNINISDNTGCKPYLLTGSFICECISDAGVISGKATACIGDTLKFNNVNNVIDPNDTIVYVISDASTLDLNNILKVLSDPTVLFDSTYIIPGFNKYYIFAVVANKSSNGLGIDFNDPCLDYSNGAIFSFQYIPEFYFLLEDTILNCNNFTLKITAKNTLPIFASQLYNYWSTVNGNILTMDTINGPPFITINKNGTYTFKRVNKEAGCTFEKDIFIDIQTEAPIIQLKHQEEIGCQINELYLDASGSTFGNTYQVDWTTNNGNIISGNNELTPLIDKTGTYYIEITDLKNGCNSIDSVLVSQVPEIEVNNIDFKNPGCAGKADGSINISNITGGKPPYQYKLNGVNSPSPDFTKLSSGSYIIGISDAFGCIFDTTVLLDSPSDINLELGNDITVEWGTVVKLNAELNIPLNELDTLIWFNIDSASCSFCEHPEFIATKNTLVKALAINKSCEDKDELRVIVEKIHDVYIPNTFSPNANGINDKFVIFGGKNVVRVQKFEIFNRWGGRVFLAEDFYPDGTQGGWNGKLGSQYLNESVFVYYALIEFNDGDIELFKGDVTLIR